jgi:hypothetical protein
MTAPLKDMSVFKCVLELSFVIYATFPETSVKKNRVPSKQTLVIGGDTSPYKREFTYSPPFTGAVWSEFSDKSAKV